jgi:hypothetical protein
VTPEEILKTASDIAEGKRDANGAENSFNLIADLWTAYLREASGMEATLLPSDVAQMMVLLKVARSVCGSPNPDHYVDQAGYSAWAGYLRDTGETQADVMLTQMVAAAEKRGSAAASVLVAASALPHNIDERLNDAMRSMQNWDAMQNKSHQSR